MRSLIFSGYASAQAAVGKWGELLSDVPAAGAILDRLLHHAEIIPINGRSYRLQTTAKQPSIKK